ncbi:alpha/beta fold hydrolase [Escherichia coli]|uniref:alpha/beta fold hydrolase n=1 Tax=Escherichia coli TaxID=562 RepID=UPI003B2856F7
MASHNLRESWDIIGFDPRGVGQIHSDNKLPAIRYRDSGNITGKQQVLNKINACIHNTGAEVIRHIGSNEAVYDIDRIRQALGDKQLTAVAYSYGTPNCSLICRTFSLQRKIYRS